MSVNKVIAIGRLGRSPEIKSLPNGTLVAEFSIAVSEKWKDKSTGGMQERTEWMNIKVFGAMAKVCEQYLNKGSNVYIEGKLQTSSWEDKNGGAKRYKTEIIAQTVQFLDDKKQEPENSEPVRSPMFTADEIPF